MPPSQVDKWLTHLAAAQRLVAGELEDIHDELRHRVPAHPKEDILAILDEEQPMPLQLLRRKRQRRGQDDAVLADGARLQG